MTLFAVYIEGIMAVLRLLSVKIKEYSSRRWSRAFFCFTVGLLLVLIVGLRYEKVGADTQTYMDAFRSIRRIEWEEILTANYMHFEHGYMIINKLVGSFSDSAQVLCVVCSLISLGPIAYWIYKKSEYPLLSFIVLIGMPSFAWSFSAVRQMMAVGVCAVAILAIQNKRIAWFVVLVLIASSFHISAILFCVAYPVYWYRVKNRVFTLALLIGAFVLRAQLFSIVKLIFNRGEYVAVSSNSYALVVVYVTMYCLFSALSKNNMEHNGLLNVFFLACLSQTFGSISVVAARMSYYFCPAIIMMIPRIIRDYNERNTRHALYFCTLICFGIYAIYSLGGSLIPSGSGGYFFWQH